MLLDHVNAVTLKDMQSVFKEYTNGIQWNYLGDTTLADKASFERVVFDPKEQIKESKPSKVNVKKD